MADTNAGVSGKIEVEVIIPILRVANLRDSVRFYVDVRPRISQ